MHRLEQVDWADATSLAGGGPRRPAFFLDPSSRTSTNHSCAVTTAVRQEGRCLTHSSRQSKMRRLFTACTMSFAEANSPPRKSNSTNKMTSEKSRCSECRVSSAAPCGSRSVAVSSRARRDHGRPEFGRRQARHPRLGARPQVSVLRSHDKIRSRPRAKSSASRSLLATDRSARPSRPRTSRPRSPAVSTASSSARTK